MEESQEHEFGLHLDTFADHGQLNFTQLSRVASSVKNNESSWSGEVYNFFFGKKVKDIFKEIPNKSKKGSFHSSHLMKKIFDVDEVEESKHDEERMLRSLFDSFDTSHSGDLDFNELVKGLKTLGVFESHHQVRLIMDEIDVHGNNSINFEDFCQAFEIAKADQTSAFSVIMQSSASFHVSTKEAAVISRVYTKHVYGTRESSTVISNALQNEGITVEYTEFSSRISTFGRGSYDEFLSIIVETRTETEVENVQNKSVDEVTESVNTSDDEGNQLVLTAEQLLALLTYLELHSWIDSLIQVIVLDVVGLHKGPPIVARGSSMYQAVVAMVSERTTDRYVFSSSIKAFVAGITYLPAIGASIRGSKNIDELKHFGLRGYESYDELGNGVVVGESVPDESPDIAYSPHLEQSWMGLIGQYENENTLGVSADMHLTPGGVVPTIGATFSQYRSTTYTLMPGRNVDSLGRPILRAFMAKNTLDAWFFVADCQDDDPQLEFISGFKWSKVFGITPDITISVPSSIREYAAPGSLAIKGNVLHSILISSGFTQGTAGGCTSNMCKAYYKMSLGIFVIVFNNDHLVQARSTGQGANLDDPIEKVFPVGYTYGCVTETVVEFSPSPSMGGLGGWVFLG